MHRIPSIHWWFEVPHAVLHVDPSSECPHSVSISWFDRVGHWSPPTVPKNALDWWYHGIVFWKIILKAYRRATFASKFVQATTVGRCRYWHRSHQLQAATVSSYKPTCYLALAAFHHNDSPRRYCSRFYGPVHRGRHSFPRLHRWLMGYFGKSLIHSYSRFLWHLTTSLSASQIYSAAFGSPDCQWNLNCASVIFSSH